MLSTLKSAYRKIQQAKASMDISAVCASRSSRILHEQYVRELLSDSRYGDSRSLARARFQVFSQFGQDGIIAEIFRRIGVDHHRFVEIGVAPLESNTTFLLLQGWNGLWIDRSLPEYGRLPTGIRNTVDKKHLLVSRAFVGRENILTLLKDYGFDAGLDFLSVDIDYNTYHVWREIARLRPRVICVEYNSHIPPDVQWVAPYVADGGWDRTIVYCASLKSFEVAGSEFGYCLVGCELGGTDAFFVREDLVDDKFLSPFTAEQHYEPPRIFLAVPPGHLKGFARTDGSIA